MVESNQQSNLTDIFVQCMQQGRKLRLRIVNSLHYNQILNCSGPKGIRTPGAIFKLKNPKISIMGSGSKMYYKLPNKVELYEIIQNTLATTTSIQNNWITKDQLKQLGIAIYEEPLCVICLENPANVILLPCGHKQFCKPCIDVQRQTKASYIGGNISNKCCICRGIFTSHYEVQDEELQSLSTSLNNLSINQ